MKTSQEVTIEPTVENTNSGSIAEILVAVNGLLTGAGVDNIQIGNALRELNAGVANDKLLKIIADGVKQATSAVEETSTKLEKMRSELIPRLKKAEDMAMRDPMTGMGNRRKLEKQVNAIDGHTKNSFMIIDIDHFKSINDKYGHHVGDEVLVKVAELIKNLTRNTDIFNRIGGEEFCGAFTNVSIEEATKIGEKIRKAISETVIESEKGPISITISAGVAQLKEGESFDECLKRADEALCSAKSGGRNKVVTSGTDQRAMR